MTGAARWLALALLALIALYRGGVSPFIGPRCRYLPTCSAYMEEAIRRHGPMRGTALGLRRLARCHPVRVLGGGSGFDPVPDLPGHGPHLPRKPDHA